MVFEEVLQEIRADDLARRAAPSERLGDEAQVLLKRFGAVGRAHEFREAPHDVVVEVLVVGDGQHVVGVGHEADARWVAARHLVEVVGKHGSLVGQDEPVGVE